MARDARAQGKALLREIKLADADARNLSRLSGEVVKWYGTFELSLAEQAPSVFAEFRSPGIPVGSVTAEGTTVNEPITLKVLRRVVKDDLARLKAIETRLTGSVWRVRFLRLRRSLRKRMRSGQ